VPLVAPRVILPDFSVGTPEQAIAIEQAKIRLLTSKFFLVKTSGNAGLGEGLRCRGCGGKHRYLTLRCVEQPFDGLNHALYAYVKTAGDTGAVAYMNPAQRARYEKAGRIFEPLGDTPDLATSHPLTARKLQGDVRDVDVGAVALGLLEPISKAMAQQLADRINARGCKPPFTLPGLTR
jgi:hypothetical protein